RKRVADLATLTDQWLARLATHYRRDPVRLTSEVRQVLARYHWPGNVRELRSVLERAIVLSHGNTVTTQDLPERMLAGPRARALTLSAARGSLHDLERHHIELALRECATLEDAANRLGINATTLWRKRKRYGLT